MMLKSLKTALCLAVFGAWPLSALAEDMTADTVVAEVNGTEITLGHVIAVREGLPQQYAELPDDILWKGILDQLVQQTVLAQSGRENLSKRAQLALQNEERAIRAAQAVQDVIGEAVTDDAIQAAYDEQFSDGGGTEYNAAHILVETEEQAAKLAADARDGADFATLAKENSTGPSGPNGGDLGWFGEGMMVAPFENAVKALEVGAVSDPVQTQFGWHVIKLNETRAKEAPALDQVRAELEQQVQNAAVEARIQELLGAADVTRTEATDIDAAILNNTDLLEQ